MSISVRCPSCQQTIKAAEKYAGLRVKCPGCQSVVSVPMPVQAQTPTDQTQPLTHAGTVPLTDDALITVSPSMFRNRPIWFVVCVLLILAYGIGLLFLVVWWLMCKTTRLTVTGKRTILRKGILSKHTKDVRHKDIRLVEVQQSFIQRIFGVGNIAISSAGHGGVEIEIAGIPNPQELKQGIDKLRD